MQAIGLDGLTVGAFDHITLEGDQQQGQGQGAQGDPETYPQMFHGLG